MIFGVILWVALAAIVPTMVLPTIQYAVAPSTMPATPDTEPKAASDSPRVADSSAPG